MTRFRKIGRPGDGAKLLAWANSPEVKPYMYRDHIITETEHYAWYTKAMGSLTQFIIQADDEDVGFAQCSCVSQKDKRWTWGHYIAEPSARGKGVGKATEFLMTDYVFSLGAHKVGIEVFAWNELPIAMHERFGYIREAHYKRHIFKDGKYHDVIGLWMTDDIWAELRPQRLDWLEPKKLAA